jgi:transposase
MQVVHPICCGIDVHQAPLTACLRCVSDEGQITTELRDFGTTYGEFLALSDWLVAVHCPIATTGQCWSTSQSDKARRDG